ncbi:DNA alkylation repair protein [Candidatus Falkowbacteria bacterium RIFOXYA2_FULL_35_8]|uniref:DNA alkylation repair protein n=1 Tax=Candidatus Falkowbacteria bacterium RIFOXYC2_FULL_36_12 TaxID=1798002 RepID=A0A1F5T4A3_9BACT|nr:MAG: DNA alkylation repair protein [Candidatus Falkowbacteria bacterium RIFOXYC2_FULL_36_12]OGF33724.1 MAG: DNA alkylation repair protein [Candidatus Falkowbacteria bacterium RIFOXYA2_FULL_35_8]
MKAENVKKELKKVADPKKAKDLSWFFKTGKGEYGEGDRFLGINMGEQRRIAKEFKDLELTEVQKLLKNKFHEERMTALLILVYKFAEADEKLRKQIFEVYLKNTKYINNWDLVDVTAPRIVGSYLIDKERKVLYKMARSKNLWQKRIAVLATFIFIKEKQFEDSLNIAKILLNDKHDLIHKAVGWMLREVGNQEQAVEEKFLQKYYKKMPRTMFRYAIEKFEEGKRQRYLKGVI